AEIARRGRRPTVSRGSVCGRTPTSLQSIMRAEDSTATLDRSPPAVNVQLGSGACLMRAGVLRSYQGAIYRAGSMERAGKTVDLMAGSTLQHGADARLI